MFASDLLNSLVWTEPWLVLLIPGPVRRCTQSSRGPLTNAAHQEQALRSSCELLRLGRLDRLDRTACMQYAVKSSMPAIRCHKDCMQSISCHKHCMPVIICLWHCLLVISCHKHCMPVMSCLRHCIIVINCLDLI